MTILIGLFSCQDDSVPLPPKEAILGKWKEVAVGFDKTMSLEPSKTIKEFLPDGVYIEDDYRGEYRIDSEYFYYCHDGVDDSMFKYNFSGDRLQLEFISFADGSFPYVLNRAIYFHYKKVE